MNKTEQLPVGKNRPKLPPNIVLAQEKAPDAWDALDKLAGSIEGPADWSQNLDHYLYGSPKRKSDEPLPDIAAVLAKLQQAKAQTVETLALIQQAITSLGG